MTRTQSLTPTGERIVTGMQAYDIHSAAQLAAHVQKSQATIHRWLHAPIVSADPLGLIRVAETIHLSLKWLMTGEGTPAPRDYVDPDEAALLQLRRQMTPEQCERLTEAARDIIIGA